MSFPFHKNIKLCIFDFDGTLVDSNQIKLEAFDTCFSDYLDAYPEIVSYCHSNHHTPRWVKFRHVYENIMKLTYTPKIERDLHHRYESVTTQAIIKAQEIKGATKFLKTVTSKLPAALLSSTPHEVLIQILDGRKWRSYFRYVQGAPIKKSDWILALRERLGLSNDEVVFIGDTAEDAESAKTANCPFVAVANPELANKEFPFAKNFIGLKVAA